VGIVVQFIVWDIFSNGSWRQRKQPTLQPARLLQDEVVYLRSQMRKMEYKHRMSIAELDQRYQEKLKLQAQKAIIK
jgi:hypothetical protein